MSTGGGWFPHGQKHGIQQMRNELGEFVQRYVPCEDRGFERRLLCLHEHRRHEEALKCLLTYLDTRQAFSIGR